MVEPKNLVKPIELTLVTPAGESHRVLMKRSPFVIGRHESCDMVLNSHSVSRLHCQLKVKSFGLTVKDLGSRNGTYLDDAPLTPKERIPLKEGNVVSIGRFRLRVDRIQSEVEIAEDGALLPLPSLQSPVHLSSSIPSSHPNEPDALLAELEQFIVHSHHKRRPRDHQAIALTTDTIARSESTPPDQDPSHSLSSDTAPTQAETVVDKLLSTKVSDSLSQGQTIGDSEEDEPDESERQRLKLREQLDAMKPRDSKDAAIQALRNLFGHR